LRIPDIPSEHDMTLAPNPVHRPMPDLEAGMRHLLEAPRDGGVLELIVIRPDKDERTTLGEAWLSPEEGVQGDNWAKGCWKSLPDGRPDPDVQITIMSSRLARLVMGEDQAHWALAGDQLVADLDLSDENLPHGQRLAVGKAILEITAVPHRGCVKYRDRFGDEALRFISTDEGRRMNLRGIYAKVIQAGQVRVGDIFKKIGHS
jgi:hypothetical protein